MKAKGEAYGQIPGLPGMGFQRHSDGQVHTQGWPRKEAMLADQHLWNVDGHCTTHNGMCGKVPFIPDEDWRSHVVARKHRVPTLGTVMTKNKNLVAANARLSVRVERQGEYIHFLHNWFKEQKVQIPRQVKSK